MFKNRLKQQVDCIHCPVQLFCLPRNLQPAEIKELNALISNMKVVKKNEHAFHAQDTMLQLYAVYSGSCKDYWLDENGNQRIDNFYFPGDIIGLESIPNRKHFFSLVALEDTQLCIIPINELFTLMQKFDSILKRIINVTSYKMQNDLHVSLTTNANQRVADFLLNILHRMQERNKIDDHIILPMSQIDVSHFLGMAHETVNRILRKLHNEKIIKISGKKIYIIDVARLKALDTSMTYFPQV